MHRADPAIRRRRWLAVALVPALLARALVPAGFMPAIGAGSLALVFCDAGAVAAAGPHAHHHAHREDGAGRGSRAAPGECPFAQSAAPALPSLPPLVDVQRPVAPLAAARPGDQIFPAVPPRHAAARGPPESC